MRALLSWIVVFAAACAACSSSDRPAPSAGGGTFGSSSGGAPAPAADAGDADAGGDPCSGIEPLGEEVAEVGLPGDAPSGAGGTIAAGTYALVELDAFGVPNDGGPPGPTGNVGRATLIIEGRTLRVLASRGARGSPGADHAEAFTFTSNGGALDLVSVCPTPGQRRHVAFTASGAGLTLFPDPKHAELYERR